LDATLTVNLVLTALPVGASISWLMTDFVI